MVSEVIESGLHKVLSLIIHSFVLVSLHLAMLDLELIFYVMLAESLAMVQTFLMI